MAGGAHRGGVLLAGRPQDYQTYRIAAPVASHWRSATCAEFDCQYYREGWATEVDEATPLGQGQATYIRRDSGRGYAESRTPAGLTRFEFEPGQTCFAAHTHKVPVGRPPFWLVRWGVPGNSRPLRSHTSGESWADDCRTHLEQIAKERE